MSRIIPIPGSVLFQKQEFYSDIPLLDLSAILYFNVHRSCLEHSKLCSKANSMISLRKLIRSALVSWQNWWTVKWSHRVLNVISRLIFLLSHQPVGWCLWELQIFNCVIEPCANENSNNVIMILNRMSWLAEIVSLCKT